jgi:hypothetical protein
VTDLTPAAVANRPGLPAVQYRVGTYGTFFETMQAALSSADVPALAGLRTRAAGDFSLALVDAWSVALDVLTFYTERLANEAYLGTAVESRSVFELARLVGYRPAPGVSASAVLAFTLASAPGAPAVVPLPAGIRVQSVPGPGQMPQVFETSSALTATVAGNAIPAATSVPWTLQGGDTSTWIAGTANNVKVGDALLFLSAPGGVPAVAGPASVVYVTAVTVDSGSGNTQIAWNTKLAAGIAGAEVAMYVFRTKAALYGANAPKPGMFAATVLMNIPGAPSAPYSSNSEWAWYFGDNATVNLDSSVAGLSPTASGTKARADQAQWMVLTGPKYTSFFQIQSASESNPGLYALSAKTTQLTLASGTVLAGDMALSNYLNWLLYEFVQETRSTTAYVGSQLLTGANLPVTDWTLSGTYPLSQGMLAPVSGGALTLAGLQALSVNAPVAVNGKRVRIAAAQGLNGTNGGFTPAGANGALAASAGQAFLVDAFPPVADPGVSGNLLWNVLTVTGAAGLLSVPAGGFVLQPSVTADPATGEAVVLSDVTVNGATTALSLNAPLTRIYDATTVTLNANAVMATHGETVKEILGSGDGTNAALEFQLKQSPLTYVSAATGTGVQSTLQVRVNNLLWNEVDNFLNAGGSDRVYVTIPNAPGPNSTGGPSVEFGDGVHGSRTPTGQSNIVATYRKGIGAAGNVAPGQLTQPLDRPQGLQSVTNPSIATGGADPATAASARMSAPLPTLTLGRVVSLEDYQNFALNFGGIALALASWTWFGTTKGIFLTVAGQGGTVLNANDAVVTNLVASLGNYGLPYVPVQVVSYAPALFEVAMQVKADTPTYVATDVVAQVWQGLAAAFAFGQVAPGQTVAASQVIELAQAVPGVLGVNLTAFNRSGDAAVVNNILCAAGPLPTATPPQGAEILQLDPATQGLVGVWA